MPPIRIEGLTKTYRDGPCAVDRVDLEVRDGGFMVLVGPPDVAIADRPRFAWRGVMLDVARHFFGVADVCRLIDHLAAYKLNVLHLHLSRRPGLAAGDRRVAAAG